MSTLLHIENQVSLKAYNTFGIEAMAERFVVVTEVAQLSALADTPGKKFVLGGGSNILLAGDVHGLVLHNKLEGKKIIKEDADHVWLDVMSGEVWHELVKYAVGQGWGGIENLALIPGTVGAAPMQNIGAYGVEAKDVIDAVAYYEWDSRSLHIVENKNCEFGYRDSIFKRALRDKVFITSVVFRLSKNPVINSKYGAIEAELARKGVMQPGIKDVAEAVIRIRTSKLPDPKHIGNAGSFFKNPEVATSVFESLHKKFPDIPSYNAGEGMKKIPAGWLIEQCGWKGHITGATGVHDRQALVLVNKGGATGAEILALSSSIMESVTNKFGITIEREVQIW